MAALLTDCDRRAPGPAVGAAHGVVRVLLERRVSLVRRRESCRPARPRPAPGRAAPGSSGVPGPWAQKPKYQSDEWMISHPEKQTASTR